MGACARYRQDLLNSIHFIRMSSMSLACQLEFDWALNGRRCRYSTATTTTTTTNTSLDSLKRERASKRSHATARCKQSGAMAQTARRPLI